MLYTGYIEQMAVFDALQLVSYCNHGSWSVTVTIAVFDAFTVVNDCV
jgi:hypothetical protein